MKKVVFVILAISFIGLGIYVFIHRSAAKTEAVTNKTMDKTEKAQQETDKVAAGANFSADQRDKVYQILLQYHSQKDQILKTGAGRNNPETKAKIDLLRDSVDAKVKAVLTPEQYQIVKAEHPM